MTTNLTISMHKREIPTPALLIDYDAFMFNLNRMSEFCKTSGHAALRPHIKTHKCPIIAHLQVSAGAIGITCAKLSEAEVMVEHGITDILIANQIAGHGKPERLAMLAKHAAITVAVDNIANIDDLSRAAQQFNATIGILVEVNVGNNRCGSRSLDETLTLAKHIASKQGLLLKGVMGYEGHVVFITDRNERIEACRAANKILVDSAEMLRSNGFKIPIVSAGGTGTYDMSGTYSGITEIEAGSYVFMDGCYFGVIDSGFRPALSVLSTVISQPEKGLAILDAGMKSLTHEFGMPKPLLKGATIEGLSEEHGRLVLSAESPDLKVGDLVEVMPSHGCTTVNLHNRYCVIRNDRLEAVWDIACRGMSW